MLINIANKKFSEITLSLLNSFILVNILLIIAKSFILQIISPNVDFLSKKFRGFLPLSKMVREMGDRTSKVSLPQDFKC